MNFVKQKNKECFLHDTPVENIFINEYMPAAPGDYVKVFIFALMYSGYDAGINNEAIAKHLDMQEEDVLKAWSYWESLGVVKKTHRDKADKWNFRIDFLSLKEKMYSPKSGKNTFKSENAKKLVEKELKKLYDDIEQATERLLEGRETEEILSWITDYKMSSEVIVFAYKYAKERRNQTRTNYVGAILKDWHGRGLYKLSDIESFLTDTDSRHYNYKRVMQALGFLRNPTEAEKAMMDSWFDEMGMNIDTVLDACGKTTGISNPNLNYVNSVIKGKVSGKAATSINGAAAGGGAKNNSIQRAEQYYEEMRKKAEDSAKARRQEVYKKIPRIKELDDAIRDIGIKISRSMIINGGSNSASGELIREQKRLLGEKAFLMTENNFVPDYMDIRYSCEECKDTGMLETGERCKCYKDILAKLE